MGCHVWVFKSLVVQKTATLQHSTITIKLDQYCALMPNVSFTAVESCILQHYCIRLPYILMLIALCPPTVEAQSHFYEYICYKRLT